MADYNAALLTEDMARASAIALLSSPDDAVLIDTARLLMRYTADGFGAPIHQSLLRAISNWGMTREQLHTRTRALWSSGWRPPLDPVQQLDGVAVGSGADVGVA